MNIYEMPPLPLAEEVTTILTENENIRIEKIISTGQVSDWYNQDETEFVILLESNAVIEYENNKTVAISKGDTLRINPHERHKDVFLMPERFFPQFWA